MWASSLSRAEKAASLVSGVAIGLLMFLTVADGLRRFVWGQSVPGTVEITQVALVVVVYLGLMSAETSRSHVRTGLLTDRLPPSVGRWVRLVGQLVALAVVLLLAYQTWGDAAKAVASGQSQYGLIRVPIWPAKVTIPLGFGLLALAIVAHLIVLVRRHSDGAEAPPGGGATDSGH